MAYILEAQIRQIIHAGTPLCALTSPDPWETEHTISNWLGALEHPDTPAPCLHWDVVSGLIPLNTVAKQKVNCKPPAQTQAPQQMLAALDEFSGVKIDLGHGEFTYSNVLVFAQNLHGHFQNWQVVQWLANLRNVLQGKAVSLILIGVDIQIPPALKYDFTLLDEPLPGTEALTELVKFQYEQAGYAIPDAPALEKTITAVRGLSAYGVVQETAMAMTQEGIDLPTLWTRKRLVIEQTPGLSCWMGCETFADIGGNAQVKQFLTAVLHGEQEYQAVVWLDEIADAMAGADGDGTGVSQDIHGTLLSFMVDHEVSGMILYGVPGSGKSMTAKATGGELGVPTVRFDVNATKNKYVGQTGQQIRQALKVISAMSDNRIIFLATTNSMHGLSPQFQQRFDLGVWFFDLPSAEERDSIVQINRQRWHIAASAAVPDMTNWSGRDITNCFRLAHQLHCTPAEAAQYQVPGYKSGYENIQAMRHEANNRYLSAAYAGAYRMPDEGLPTVAQQPERIMNMHLGGRRPPRPRANEN